MLGLSSAAWLAKVYVADDRLVQDQTLQQNLPTKSNFTKTKPECKNVLRKKNSLIEKPNLVDHASNASRHSVQYGIHSRSGHDIGQI
ncbi:hypothetical protein P5673_024287 [Acropora cervicornis]|uniref:Uncharacterized protein n=1 Tax=Acropora cervicornis TaxID=6130 RepID=A0AAD9UYE0_ACRCE|nr:hypothetical protein P5673_024287 [Acropora cervicornis]